MDPVSRDAGTFKTGTRHKAQQAPTPAIRNDEKGFWRHSPLPRNLGRLGTGHAAVAMASAKTRHALNEVPSAKCCGLRQGLANHSGLPTSGTAAKTVTLPKAVLGNYAVLSKSRNVTGVGRHKKLGSCGVTSLVCYEGTDAAFDSGQPSMRAFRNILCRIRYTNTVLGSPGPCKCR